MDKLLIVNLLLIASIAGLAGHFGANLPISLACGFLAASATNIAMAGR